MDYDIKLPVSECFQTHDDVLFVEEFSIKEIRDALEQIAGYFKKEFRYDHLQYCANDKNKDCIGFLFVDRAMDLVEDMNHHPYRVLGGGCFRKLNNDSFQLDWVWLHPFVRNRNKLKRQWPKFQDKFGAFTITSPLSAHMAKFVEKYA